MTDLDRLFLDSNSSRPLSDLEEAQLQQQRQGQSQHHQEAAVNHALHAVGTWLQQAEGGLAALERDQLLGPAILRGCQELADAMTGLANAIEQQPESAPSLAQSVRDDVSNHSLVLKNETSTTTTTTEQEQQQLLLLANLSDEQMTVAVREASHLLRDVADVLGTISQDEANEIADVALLVAHMFVTSLQSVHAATTTIPRNNDDIGTVVQESSSQRIQIIEDVEEESEESSSTSSLHEGTAVKSPQKWDKEDTKRMDRLRVLWPPLGPAVASALDWGQQEASQKPLLAVALGITLWPTAVLVAVIGTPAVLVDGWVQNVYTNFEDAPIIVGLERSAAQLYHSGRLSLLCGKLLGRQTLRIVQRQVERHGGAGQMVHDLGGMALDRAMHPIETIGTIVSGVSWGIGAAMDAVAHLNDQERDSTVQTLQQ